MIKFLRSFCYKSYYKTQTKFVNSFQHFNRISVKNHYEVESFPPKDFNKILLDSVPVEGSVIEFIDGVPKIGLVIRRALSRFDERYNKLLVITNDNEMIQVSPQMVNLHFQIIQSFNFEDIVKERFDSNHDERNQIVKFINRFIEDSLEMKRAISLDIVYSQLASREIKPVSMIEIIDALKFKEARLIQITSSLYYQCVLLQSIYWNMIDSCQWIVPNAIPNNKRTNLFNNHSNSYTAKQDYFINSEQTWQSINQYYHTKEHFSTFMDKLKSLPKDEIESYLSVYEGRHHRHFLDVMNFAKSYPHNSIMESSADTAIELPQNNHTYETVVKSSLPTKRYYQDHVIYGIQINNLIVGVSIETINSRKYIFNIHIPEKYQNGFNSCMTISFKYSLFENNIFQNIHEKVSISHDFIPNLTHKFVDSDTLNKCLSGKLQSNLYNLLRREKQQLTKLDIQNINYINGVLKHFFKLRQHNGGAISFTSFCKEIEIFANYLTAEYCHLKNIPVDFKSQELALEHYSNDKIMIQHDNLMIPFYEADSYNQCIMAKNTNSLISPMAYYASMNYLTPEVSAPGPHVRLGLDRYVHLLSSLTPRRNQIIIALPRINDCVITYIQQFETYLVCKGVTSGVEVDILTNNYNLKVGYRITGEILYRKPNFCLLKDVDYIQE